MSRFGIADVGGQVLHQSRHASIGEFRHLFYDFIDFLTAIGWGVYGLLRFQDDNHVIGVHLGQDFGISCPSPAQYLCVLAFVQECNAGFG